MAIKVHSSFSVHPGTWLRTELVEPYRLTIVAGAEALGVTRVALSNLLNDKAALCANMALRFEKGFGISADTMMRMQASYDVAQARTHADELHVTRVAKAA
ncbi:HigA family addiction module antitoxin [Novosphingobium sp. P6W]|uniref:HigA family addiction module antitoxin n=1 Tax=Novosphingobium sp. P6W TaxID=1609758 RepID=UPI0005C30D63|nr:HigA family addiction module antitoxin [Novosphingobium sp. P6W]AXB80629.1 addiction module antidote protein, HigA family [Novosphingobium sp. P6W]KIS30067.1 XRE family transcriptional regulator [Novosphingobium sp. P6W]